MEIFSILAGLVSNTFALVFNAGMLVAILALLGVGIALAIICVAPWLLLVAAIAFFIFVLL